MKETGNFITAFKSLARFYLEMEYEAIIYVGILSLHNKYIQLIKIRKEILKFYILNLGAIEKIKK